MYQVYFNAIIINHRAYKCQSFFIFRCKKIQKPLDKRYLRVYNDSKIKEEMPYVLPHRCCYALSYPFRLDEYQGFFLPFCSTLFFVLLFLLLLLLCEQHFPQRTCFFRAVIFYRRQGALPTRKGSFFALFIIILPKGKERKTP